MNALTRILALLPFAVTVASATFSAGCGSSTDGAGGGGSGDDTSECTGGQPACATGCGGSTGATCSGSTWVCPAVPDAVPCLPPASDGGAPGDDGGAACGDVQPDCSFTDCNGDVVSGAPTCNEGVWECPEYATPACIIATDAGTGDDDGSASCFGPAPACTEKGCDGTTVTTSASCSNGEWECDALPIACIEDGGPGPGDGDGGSVDAGAAPAPDAGTTCAGAAPVCIGRDCDGNAISFQPTCSSFGWACIEPPVACPAGSVGNP